MSAAGLYTARALGQQCAASGCGLRGAIAGGSTARRRVQTVGGHCDGTAADSLEVLLARGVVVLEASLHSVDEVAEELRGRAATPP